MSPEVETPREHSWRDVRQAVNPRAMTNHGLRRRRWSLLRTGLGVAVIGAIAIGVAYVYVTTGFQEPTMKLAPVVKAEPLREILVLTDGVLTRDWAADRLALPADIALMAIDLDAVRARLEREGQIKRVVVAREFPGTLVVTLEERAPVVRVMVPINPQRPEALVVAPDGTVYRGFNYDPLMIERLPWLDGVRLARRSNGDFVPIEGMDQVTELLVAAQHEAPHLVRTWNVVSLAESPRIIVRSPAVRAMVLEPARYRSQFARLDFILDQYRERAAQQGGFARIDVSLPSLVVVEFATGEILRPALRETALSSSRNR